MEKYHKEYRDRFELETKKHHDLIGEHHLPSWDYVFWLEDFIQQLKNTPSNSDYAKCDKIARQIYDHRHHICYDDVRYLIRDHFA